MFLKSDIKMFLKSGTGFTLIELLVAVSILAILAGLVMVNFAGLRTDRNLNIAQNELVTNLRNAQSYTLSSKLVSGNQSGQFFILKFDAAKPGQYGLQAVYNIFATPTLPTLVDNIETYRLPAGIQVAAAPLTIYRSPYTVQTPACGLVAFKAPFARVYLNSGCNFNNFNGSGDDYNSLLQYVVNTENSHTSADSYAVIQVTDTKSNKSRYVLVRGVTGVICPAAYDVPTSSYKCVN
jgi:prepilin-type N-terminal cleavage/methylation domain-containing protein